MREGTTVVESRESQLGIAYACLSLEREGCHRRAAATLKVKG